MCSCGHVGVSLCDSLHMRTDAPGGWGEGVHANCMLFGYDFESFAHVFGDLHCVLVHTQL